MENFRPELPQRVELWENVLTALRTAILRGDLPAGTRLVEAELADKLRVSRGPIREALSRLEQEGLVEGMPRRGTVVLGLSDQDVSEVYGMRNLLECFGARLAAARAKAADGDALRGRLAEMRELLRRGMTQDVAEKDIDFHRAVLELTGSRRLIAAWEPIAGTARTMLVITNDVYHDVPGLLDDHEQLVEAVLRHDADEAEAAMRRHLSNGERAINVIKQGAKTAAAALGGV